MPASETSLTQAVKAEAQRLGFQLVGVTTPQAPPHYSTFERWLAEGRHGEMAYLATERARQCRADPLQLLPECRSILVLGIRYPKPDDLAAETSAPSKSARHDGALSGQVAAYAWGKDYHDVLPVRLRALVNFIQSRVGHPVPNRWYTDAGPLLERDLAQRAGLGWIGKNTCLIHPKYGSYFLLAEVLLGIELEADPPFPTDHCGVCTRCLDACPTACILPDRTLDARRCISYLTIELKGTIPRDLRQAIGNWIFGCDICQQVCPWNRRFATPEGDPDFAPQPGAAQPDLIQELRLTPEEFNRKFRARPQQRPRRRGYLRNVAVALGNVGDSQAIPHLATSLMQEAEPLVRAHAAWALGKIAGEVALQALQQALDSETDEGVLAEIRAALSEISENSGQGERSATDA